MIQVLVGVAALMAVGWLVSPLETFSWWRRAGAQHAQRELVANAARREERPVPSTGAVWLVFVSGINAVQRNVDGAAEVRLLDAIQTAEPRVRVVRDVYPYSVDNSDLVSRRATARIWRMLDWLGKRRWFSVANAIIALRNIFQLLVSADPRYGPLYSSGVAASLEQQLEAAGRPAGSRDPVVLLAWSGGAQIALGAAWFLVADGIPTTMVSLGGVFTSDPALDRVDHLYHLYGTKDMITRLSPILFPGRRRLARHSAWNRALSDGRVTLRCLGPLKHVGRGSYLSRAPIDGKPCFQITADAITDVVRGLGVPHPERGQ